MSVLGKRKLDSESQDLPSTKRHKSSHLDYTGYKYWHEETVWVRSDDYPWWPAKCDFPELFTDKGQPRLRVRWFGENNDCVELRRNRIKPFSLKIEPELIDAFPVHHIDLPAYERSKKKAVDYEKQRRQPIDSFEFECKKCPRTFTTNRGLASHQRVHKKRISTKHKILTKESTINLQKVEKPSLFTKNHQPATDKNSSLNAQQIANVSSTNGKKRKFDEYSNRKHNNSADQPQMKKLKLMLSDYCYKNQKHFSGHKNNIPTPNINNMYHKHTTQMFKCKKCSRQFLTNKGLASHQRVHINQKEYINPNTLQIKPNTVQNINQPNDSNTSQSLVAKTGNNNVLPFPTHLTLEEANRLKVDDKIDHRDKVGRFVYATVSEKQGTHLKIHYDNWSDKYDIWSDSHLEILRFAQAGSISKRPAHRFKHLKIGDCVNINPILKHPGWKSGKIRRFDQESGQVQVAYTLDQIYLYWTHLDNVNEIAPV